MIVQPKLVGGLGNQLFILFTAYSYGKKYGHTLYIKYENNSPSCFHPRPVYWDTILWKFQTKQENHMIDYIHKLTEKKSRIIQIEPPEFHKVVGIADFTADTSKINKLGWRAKIDYKDGVMKIVKNYQEIMKTSGD